MTCNLAYDWNFGRTDERQRFPNPLFLELNSTYSAIQSPYPSLLSPQRKTDLYASANFVPSARQ